MSVSLVYPLTVINGKIATTSDYSTIVTQVILASVMTKLEERVFFPEYGVDERLFSTVDVMPIVLVDVRRSIEQGLEEYPGVSFELYGSINDTGVLSIDVVYTVDGTQKQLTVNY